MIPRRKFLQSIFLASTFSSIPISLSCTGKIPSSGINYLTSILRILKTIETNEMDTIRNAANLFADSIISRNRCFIYTMNPISKVYLHETIPGLPPVFIPLRSKEMARTVCEGDTLLTTHPGKIPATARKVGAQIVGLTSPRVIDDYGEKYQEKFNNNLHLGDVTDTLIYSHLPVWDGLVKLPEYPFGILPGSGPVLLTIITAVAGETYRRSGGIGLTGASPPEDAIFYIDILTERIGHLIDYQDRLQQAADLAAGRILDGGRIWTYDRHDILSQEITEGAGVPVFINSISKKGITDGTLQAGDVLIFGALQSNSADDLKIIWNAREISDAIIILCPHDQTGGYRLFKESDFSLDNLSYEKDGVREFDSGTRKFMQTGSIINSILLWMVLGETTDRMIHAGKVPSYLMGTHLLGSERYNSEIRNRFSKRGY